jgi:hypothetical protein
MHSKLLESVMSLAGGAHLFAEVVGEERHGSAVKVKPVATKPEIGANVGNDSARNVTGVPGEGDQAIGLEGI